jgi:NodT family efflux transporter outer membrane factor (OMF) lipoprotein
MRMKALLKTSVAVSAAALLLGSCAVGPDFERPPPPNVKSYEPPGETMNAPEKAPTEAVISTSTPMPAPAAETQSKPAEATSAPAPASEAQNAPTGTAFAPASEPSPPVSESAPTSAVEMQSAPAETVSAPTPAGEAQTFVSGGAIPAAWWELFQSQALNRLIEEALKTNPDLDAAMAALRVAHETTAAGEGALFPTVDAGANITREKESSIAFGGSSSIPAFTLYNASVSVSYALDVFGLARRSIEELAAQEEMQRYQLEAARISLSANVVTAAVTEASLRGQIAATQTIIDDEQKQLDLLQAQLDLGGVTKAAVLAEATQLAETKATLPPLEKQLAIIRHQLSVLAGRFPADEPAAHFELADLKLPQEVPVSLPSQLVEQRPDVRAAEANWHAASAAIGVATANMLPQFPITGDLGLDAGKLAGLFEPGAGIWSLGAGLTQPIFHGGTLLHQKRAAEAGYDEAAAQYRKTVLTAFQNVADALHALRSDAEALKANAAAEQAASDSRDLSETQYKVGAVSYLAFLSAEQAEQQAKLALVASEAARYADTAALFQALGGGWWNRPDAADDLKAEAPPETAKETPETEDFGRETPPESSTPSFVPASENGEKE